MILIRPREFIQPGGLGKCETWYSTSNVNQLVTEIRWAFEPPQINLDSDEFMTQTQEMIVGEFVFMWHHFFRNIQVF